MRNKLIFCLVLIALFSFNKINSRTSECDCTAVLTFYYKGNDIHHDTINTSKTYTGIYIPVVNLTKLRVNGKEVKYDAILVTSSFAKR